MMHINKIYLHSALAFGSLVVSVIFHEEKEANVTAFRYLFALATIVNLAAAALIWTSIKTKNPDTDGDGETKTVVMAQADRDNMLPFPNPFQKPAKKETVEVTFQEYDTHLLANTVVLHSIIAVIALIYHLAKNNLLVLIWYSAFTVINTVISPLFSTHVLRQHTGGRPFRTPTLKDDITELKKVYYQAQREMKNELKAMGDDLNGPANPKKGKK